MFTTLESFLSGQPVFLTNAEYLGYGANSVVIKCGPAVEKRAMKIRFCKNAQQLQEFYTDAKRELFIGKSLTTLDLPLRRRFLKTDAVFVGTTLPKDWEHVLKEASKLPETPFFRIVVMIQEYVEGVQSLGSWLMKQKRDPIPQDLMTNIIFQCIYVLAAAQHYIGFVHNDLNLSNIMVLLTSKPSVQNTLKINSDFFVPFQVRFDIELYFVDFETSVVQLESQGDEMYSKLTPSTPKRTVWFESVQCLLNPENLLTRSFDYDIASLFNVFATLMCHNHSLLNDEELYTFSGRNPLLSDWHASTYSDILPYAKMAKSMGFESLYETIIRSTLKGDDVDGNIYQNLEAVITKHHGKFAFSFLKRLFGPDSDARLAFGVQEAIFSKYGLLNALYHPYLAMSFWKPDGNYIQYTSVSLGLPLPYLLVADSAGRMKFVLKDNGNRIEEDSKKFITNNTQLFEDEENAEYYNMVNLTLALYENIISDASKKLKEEQLQLLFKSAILPLSTSLNKLFGKNKEIWKAFSRAFPSSWISAKQKWPTAIGTPRGIITEEVPAPEAYYNFKSFSKQLEMKKMIVDLLILYSAGIALVWNHLEDFNKWKEMRIDLFNVYGQAKQDADWKDVQKNVEEILRVMYPDPSLKSRLHGLKAWSQFYDPFLGYNIDIIKDFFLIPLFSRLESNVIIQPAFEDFKQQLIETPLESQNVNDLTKTFHHLALLDDICRKKG